MVWPVSLHHQIWFGVKFRPHYKKCTSPDAYSHVFPSLQVSVSNTNQAAPESLCLMDVDAFLNAAIICASAVLEEQQLNSFMNPEKLPTLPVDLTSTLSTSNQEKWWSAAYRMCSKQENNDIGNIGELRLELQQGLEAVRCIGNHGMHPVLLVHLARMFHYRAVQGKEKEDEEESIQPWRTRSDMYWTAAIPLLERLQNNQKLCISPSKLFNYQGKEMSTVEVMDALEEGKFQLAQRFVREKQYEQAIDTLQSLKYPDASFQQALIYRILADDIVNNTSRESLTSEMRSQHVIMLSKARNCLYLTLDRLRSPGMNPKHPLNAELADHITIVENKLKRIDPDLGRGDTSRNDCDGVSDESYSPTHSAADPTSTINPAPPMITTPISISNILNTPQRNVQRVPRHTSTPCRQHHDYLNTSKNRTEVRPSPERLDAQIRQIMQSRDSEMQELVEQMKGMMTQIKSLNEKVDNLTKEVVESRKESQKHQQQQQQQRAHQQQQNIGLSVEPDDFYVFDDDEYGDLNAYPNQSAGPPASSISGNMFTSQPRHPYSSLVYPSATAFQGYYQGGMPFTDPNAQAAISSLYPHTVYPVPVLYPNQSKVPTDNPLQQGLFASTLPSQLSDLRPTAAAAAAVAAVVNPSLQMPLLQQKIETPRTKPEARLATTSTTTTTSAVVKNAPVNKVPPVNVVITSSDTLPTTVPPVQPILSVTIPPQYRLGAPGTFTSTPMTATTTATMATMGIASTTTKLPADAPHSYQIPMPSQATIPTTVNLPPSTIYVTLANNVVAPMYTSLTSNAPIMTTQATQELQQTITAWSSAQNETTNIPEKSIDTNIKPIYEPIESPNTSADITEQEHDPIPDFVPVIPLPAKVKVTTGEEDELSLYCGRAKLFRYADKEWKERGIGYVKLLRNTEGKVRLLMRRDQVLKICANHMLRPDMELCTMLNNKAWCWYANDFADEEVKLEKFCIRFKTAEEAMAFKNAFDQAKFNLTATSPEKPGLLPLFNDKNTSKTQKAQATQQAKISSTTTEAASANKSNKTGATTLGGFIFSSTPIIQEVSDTDANNSKKSEEPPKVSPFSGFSFTKSVSKSETKVTATSTAASSTGFLFGMPTIPITTSQSDLTSQSVASSIFTTSGSNQNSTTLRRPRLPAPGTKAESSAEGRPQTEHEEKIFDGIATLQCLDVNSSSTKQWKNKGTGSLKLLLNVKSGKLRLLMTDDGGSKLYGHGISLNMALTYKSGAMVVNWTLPKDAKEPGKVWLLYAATFSTPELASQFYNTVMRIQQKLTKGCSASEVAKELAKKSPASSAGKKTQNVAKSQPPPLSELFKPPVGSWECNSCYTRNKATDMKCVACDAPSPSAASNNKSGSTAVAAKPVGSTVGKPPLSELFKPAPGSWTCPGCYVINSGANVYCVACDKPKDPSQPPKPQQNVFQLNVASSLDTAPMTTFSFGIPKDTTKETSNTGFTFRKEDKSTSDNAKMVPAKSEEASGTTNFAFSMPLSTSTSNSGDKPFSFGSPTKSFNFNLAKSTKSPAKSPGDGGEVSEDEEVESEDVHFSPIVPLPDKIEVKTGEEDEEALYSHRAKLYRYDTTVKEWKERGLGDIKLLRHKESGKLRLLMRREHVLKLCLNHLLADDLKFALRDEKTWMWATADYSDGEFEYMQFACRFKTSEIAMDFKKAIDDARMGITSSSSSEKPGTKTHSSPVKEIEIVYETKVTPEEKAAALKLQLPENFYAYRRKEGCPGCRGCKEPGIILYPDTTAQDWKSGSEEKKLITPSKLASNATTASGKAAPEAARSIPQATSVKNGFSFAPASKTTTTTTATSSIFDGSKMSFGTGDLKLFNDKKTTTFSFGMNPQFSASETAEQTSPMTATASLDDVKICSPFNVQTSTSATGQATTPIFKTPTFSFEGSKNIFGGTTKTADLPETPAFGASSESSSLSFANSLPSFNTMKTSSIATTAANSAPSLTTSALGTDSFVFGPAITQNAGNTIAAAATATSTVTFNVAGQSSDTMFDSNTTSSTPFSKVFDNGAPSFATATTSVFGTTTATTTTTSVLGTTAIPTTSVNFSTATTMPNVYDAKPDNTQKNEESASFFSTDNTLFTALAVTAVQPEAFKAFGTSRNGVWRKIFVSYSSFLSVLTWLPVIFYSIHNKISNNIFEIIQTICYLFQIPTFSSPVLGHQYSARNRRRTARQLTTHRTRILRKRKNMRKTAKKTTSKNTIPTSNPLYLYRTPSKFALARRTNRKVALRV